MQENLAARLKDHQGLLAYLAIALLLAYLFGNLALSVYSTMSSATASPAASTATRDRPRPTYQASTITDANLFGQFDQSSVEPASADVPLPETNLQLTLRGAFTATDPKKASAIIEDPDGNARHYRVNAEIVAGTKLNAVHADRIVLARNGQLETLYFPEPSSDYDEDASMATNDVAAAVNDMGGGNAVPQQTQQMAEAAMRDPGKAAQMIRNLTPEQRRAIIKKRLEELRARSR